LQRWRRSTRPNGSKPAALWPRGNPPRSRVESPPRLPASESTPATGFAPVTCCSRWTGVTSRRTPPRHGPVRSLRRRHSHKLEPRTARPRLIIDWPRFGSSASRRCTRGIRPRIKNATRPKPVSQSRRRGSRAVERAATATESFATVRAPFDGLVTERLIDPGNLAAPGVPLLRIESDGARQVVVRVDEARAVYVHTGDRVSVSIDAATEPGADGNGLDGVVAEVARAVGADHRAFTVKVSLPPTVTARTGSFARVVFRGAPRRALLVPAPAIQRHGQVLSVYVVQGRVARLRLIRAGPSSSEGVEVLAGLDAGESIVVSPLTGLADGAHVTVVTMPTRTGGRS
jgi:hypothetical protein